MNANQLMLPTEHRALPHIARMLSVLACLLLPATLVGQGTIQGAVYSTWHDPIDGGRPFMEHRLVTSDGVQWKLEIPTGRPDPLSSVRPGQRVTVTGARIAANPELIGGRQVSRFRVDAVSSVTPSLVAPPPTMLRYLILRCNAVNGDAGGLTDDQLRALYDGPGPSVRDWLTEMSEGQFTFEIVGLRHVPLPASSQFYGGTPPDWHYSGALQHDCVTGATGVDWSTVDGVLLHPNWPNGVATGGATTIVFPTGVVPFRIITAGTNSPQSTIAHEVGHSLGWSHSGRDFGPPTEFVYDSPWDAMSGGGFVQTIAANRAAFEWIPTERRGQVHPGTSSEHVLETVGSGRIGPRAVGSLDMLEIIAPTGNRHLTVETRYPRGRYEEPLMRSGVLLHRLTRPLDQSHACCMAKLVDAAPFGALDHEGTVFVAGESYEHSDGIGIDVLEAVPNGYRIRAWSGWRLDVAVSGPGTVSGVPGAGTCGDNCHTLLAPSAGTITLTATPTGAQPFRFWSGACTGSGSCSVTMAGHRSVKASFGTMPLLQVARARPYGIVGLPYDDVLQVNTHNGESFTMTATGLPPGLTLASATGRISGTPSVEGSASVALTIVSASGTTRDTVTIGVVGPGETVGDTIFVARGVASWFPVPILTNGPIGGEPQVVSGALPEGFGIRADGALGGTTTDTGTFAFRLRYQMVSGLVEQNHHLVVVPYTPVIIPPTSQSFWVGRQLSQQLQLVNDMPVEWSVTAGALPQGLTLSSNGLLFGRIEESGTSAFTIEARRGTIATHLAIALSVDTPVMSEDEVVTNFMRGVPLSSPQGDYLDFVGNRNGRVDVGDVRAWLQSRGRVGSP